MTRHLLVVVALGVITASFALRLTPASAQTVTFVAVGPTHVCALTASGAVSCWGANDRGQLGTGATSEEPSTVPTAVEGLPPDVTAVAAGLRFMCALLAGGSVRCWGEGGAGELGRGGLVTDPQPTPVEPCRPSGSDCVPMTDIASISAGGSHVCAVTYAGGARCWGENSNGELGIGHQTGGQYNPMDVCQTYDAVAGVCVQPLVNVRSIAAGDSHTCALMESGRVTCWGRNDAGQLGIGNHGSVEVPWEVIDSETGQPLADIVAVAAGDWHTCALTASHHVKCWGTNSSGQLGTTTQETCYVISPGATCSRTAVAVMNSHDNELSNVEALAVGGFHSCVITLTDRVTCWGYNYYGQLGTGIVTTTPPYGSSTPTSLPGLAAFSASASGRNTCAVTATRGIKCWGSNIDGQIGDGSVGGPPRASPVDVTGFEAKPSDLTGDANCSGVVDAIDAAIVLQLAAGLITELACQDNADVNSDGLANSVDAALILQFAAGIIPVLPVR